MPTTPTRAAIYAIHLLGLDPQKASRRDTVSPATGVSVPAHFLICLNFFLDLTFSDKHPIRFHLNDYCHRAHGATIATPAGNTACRISSSPRLSYRHGATIDKIIVSVKSP